MTCKLTLLGLFVVAGVGGVWAGRPFPPSVEDPPAEVPQPKPMRVGPFIPGACIGKVTAVGVDWVELGAGWTGDDRRRKEWLEENTKTKRISAVGTTPGGDREGLGARATYRLSDLQVGDTVSIKTLYNKEEEWTTEILIHRRPGGKIPTKPGEVRPDLRGWHMEMQAEQDWEEKRIPIPAAYLRNGEYPWTNPPYPLPVAPQPREVMAKP